MASPSPIDEFAPADQTDEPLCSIPALRLRPEDCLRGCNAPLDRDGVCPCCGEGPA